MTTELFVTGLLIGFEALLGLSIAFAAYMIYTRLTERKSENSVNK